MTVTLASAAGAPIVNDKSADRAIDATEEVMKQVDADVQQVSAGADDQTKQIQVPAGQVRQTTSTNITMEQSSSGESISVEVVPIEYTSRAEPSLLYTGAFIAHSYTGDLTRDASIRMRHSSHVNDNNPVFVLPALSAEEEVSAYATSQRAANVRFDIEQSEANTSATVQTFDSSDGEIDVTIESPDHAAAWEAYFEEHPAVDSISRSSGSTTFSFTLTFGSDSVTGDTVTVTSENVVVSFTRR